MFVGGESVKQGKGTWLLDIVLFFFKKIRKKSNIYYDFQCDDSLCCAVQWDERWVVLFCQVHAQTIT